MLDTNTVSCIVNGSSLAARRSIGQLARNHSIAISAIVEGETMYGLAHKPEARRTRAAFEGLRSMFDVLPYDPAAARAYGNLRAQLAASGKPLSTMDALIAAHAISVDAFL